MVGQRREPRQAAPAARFRPARPVERSPPLWHIRAAQRCR